MINKYKVHVLNRDLNLDPTYKNVVQVFDPIAKTKDYTGVFTTDELTFYDAEEEINFNLISSIKATITLDITMDLENTTRQFMTNGTPLTIESALNRQYCIILKQEYDDENETLLSQKYYFYFLKNPRTINENLVKYDLDLDVFMTYPLFSDIDISKTKISRAHVDRFTNGSTLLNASFNLNNEFLETGEPLDTEYTKIKYEEIEPNFIKIGAPNISRSAGSDILDNAEEIIENALNNARWLYLVMHKNQGGGATDNKLIFAPYPSKTENNLKIRFAIVNDGGDYVNYQDIDANTLYNDMKDDPNIYNAFISPLAPWGYYDNGGGLLKVINYYYDANNQTLYIAFRNLNVPNYQDLEKQKIETKTFIYDSDVAIGGVFYTTTSTLESFISYFETNDIEAFKKDNINNLTNTPFNISIINDAEIKTKIKQSYNEFVLKSELDTSTLSIDLSILKTNKLKIKAINNITFNTNGEIYFTINNLYEKDLGIFTRAQYTPIMYGDKFREFKATNQNYQITSQALPIITGTIGGAVGGAKFGGVYGAIGGAIVGFGASALKVHTNFDNMKNSPNSIKLKGQQINIDNKVKSRFFNIEHNKLRDTDLKAVNLYFYEFGYNISILENIENYFTRSSFNYIQTENCEKDVHALLSNEILEIVIKALNDGVRFWTKAKYINSKFEYTTNNLESKLL